jgi:hypothetical protein
MRRPAYGSLDEGRGAGSEAVMAARRMSMGEAFIGWLL